MRLLLHVAFWVWLLSLRRMLLSFIRVVAPVRSYPFLLLSCCPLDGWTFGLLPVWSNHDESYCETFVYGLCVNMCFRFRWVDT